MRAIIDTNVFVSGIFFHGPPYAILDAWRDGRLKLIVSPAMRMFRRTFTHGRISEICAYSARGTRPVCAHLRGAHPPLPASLTLHRPGHPGASASRQYGHSRTLKGCNNPAQGKTLGSGRAPIRSVVQATASTWTSFSRRSPIVSIWTSRSK